MQAFARSIVETVRHPLLVLDAGLKVVVANPSFYKTFGSSASATEGHDFFVIDGGRWDQPRLRKLLNEVIPRAGSFKDFEVAYECAHLGRRVMVLDAHRVVRDDDGTPMVLLAIEDDTERRRVRNELRRLNLELEARAVDRTAELVVANKALLDSNRELGSTNRELEAFCYSVSHDLRSPLRAVDGFSQELLQRYVDQLDEKGKHYLKRIRAGTQRMGQLIDDLLTLSRVTRTEMQRLPVDLTALAESVAAELAGREPGRAVTFTAQPGMTAECDPALMRIVLENLLGNAWKFTSKNPEATITFCANRSCWPARVRRPRRWGWVRHGVRRQDVRRVSKVALGSRIRRDGDRPGDRSTRRPSPRRRSLGRGGGRPRGRFLLHSPRPGGSPMSEKIILLVEDNQDDEELALLAFHKGKVANDVIVARDGVEALDYLFGTGGHSGRDVSDLPQLMLLDLKLPRIDGLEVLRRVRADSRTRRLPVVILTSSKEEEDLIHAYDLGVNSYVRKPVEFDQFVEAVARLQVYWLVLNEPPPVRG